MRKFRAFAIVALLGTAFVPLKAATLNVPAQYSTIQACANAAQPGDTCLVAPGVYDERVDTVRHGAGEAGRITFKAASTGDFDPVSMRGFEVKHRYITIEGFVIEKYAGPDAGFVVLYGGNASYCRIVNNKFQNSVHQILNYTRHADNSVTYGPLDTDYISSDPDEGGRPVIYSPSARFVSAGFKAGEGRKVYLASDPNPAYRLLNSNRDRLVLLHSVKENKLILDSSETLTDERDKLGIFYMMGQMGIPAIYTTQSSNSDGTQNQVQNVVISSNVFQRLFAGSIELSGRDGEISHNIFTENFGQRAIMYSGERIRIHHNTMRKSYLFLEDPDASANVEHPTGADHIWDFQVGLMQTWVGNVYNTSGHYTKTTGHIVEYNYIEDCDNQLGLIRGRSWQDSTLPGVIFRNNVVVGVRAHLSLSLSNSVVEQNTFFRTPFNSEMILASGSSSESGPVRNLIFRNNAFVSIGTNPNDPSKKGYGMTDVTGGVMDYNYVAGPPESGYPAKNDRCLPTDTADFCEPHGINGGNPHFQNIANLLGSDGKPFTNDDGLIPLPESPLCFEGSGGQTIGAYECRRCINDTPVAHIRADKTNVNGPVSIEFDSVNSEACAGGIASYTWDFGDGTTVTGQNPKASHTFSGGVYTVTLTIVNNQGKSSSASTAVTVYPPQDGTLLLRLSMDENLTDLSGRGHRALWSGAGRYEPGVKGKAARFTGAANPYITVDHAADMAGMSKFSVSLWAKKSTPTESNVILQKHPAYTLELSQTGLIGKLAKQRDPSAASGTQNTDWQHYVFTYDGDAGHARLYINKNPVASETNTGAVSGQNFPLYIGHAFGETFDGLIDEVRVFNKALTPQEIQVLFDEGDPTIPIVTAGPDMAASVNESTALAGWVEDDQDVSELTIRWEMVSGPGPVDFEDVNNPATTATFLHAGIYILRLSVADGTSGHERSDTLVVTVQAAGKSGPQVSAGFSKFKNTITNAEESMPVSFVVSRPSHIKLSVFDRSGREVRVLADESLAAQESPYIRTWDGKNASGAPVASGIYILHLKIGGDVFTRKVGVVK